MKHYNRLYTELGLLFSTQRRKLNISQDELAKTIGINRMTISRWETGSVRIPNDMSVKLCEILGMDYDDTINQANERVAQAKVNDIHNIAINDSIRVPMYDCIPVDEPFTTLGLHKFISISSYYLDTTKKYFAYIADTNTASLRIGDILIFEHSSDYSNEDTVIAFVKENALVMPAKVCLEGGYECVGVLKELIHKFICQSEV